MVLAMSIVGVLTMIFGILLLFSVSTLKHLNTVMSRVIWNEKWVIAHREALGLLLLGLTVFIFTGVYFMSKFGM